MPYRVGAQTHCVTATARVVPQDGKWLDALRASVNAALSVGKQAGRNRVVRAPVPG